MDEIHVTIELDVGEVGVALFGEKAPKTAAYFLGLVDAGAYDETTLYRSTDLGVPDGPRLIQGGPLAGLFAPDGPVEPRRPQRTALLPEFETTHETGLRHVRGTFSMARDLIDTGHVIPEFFICLGAFPALDAGGRTEPDARGFSALGQVTRGLELLERAAMRPTEGRARLDRLAGEVLSEQLPILRVSRGENANLSHLTPSKC